MLHVPYLYTHRDPLTHFLLTANGLFISAVLYIKSTHVLKQLIRCFFTFKGVYFEGLASVNTVGLYRMVLTHIC